MIKRAITDFLNKYRIPHDAGFIIAVSGGADSISLLHAFKYLNLKIQALHCNFKLRGKESDMDEQFVKRFCETYGIALSVKKFDTAAYAKDKGISIEMAARELRYNWFAEMKTRKKMDYIVVGHHADDLAETFFINICRGTGIKGLTGIKPVNGDILRPLLSFPRTAILKYIEDNHLGYRTDSTNSSLDYVRNRIRLKVIPILKEINPGFRETMEENCEVLKETEAIFRYGIRQLQQQIITREQDELLIDIEKTMAAPAPYTFLYETLRPLGFNKTQIRDILNTQNATPGKQFTAGNYILSKGRRYWRIFNGEQHPTARFEVEEAGEYSIKGATYRFTSFPLPPDFVIPPHSSIACLDADKIKFPLLIRSWQTGDYFCPIGMKKSKKKLSDFFTDQKFTAKQKKDCLLLETDGKIAWVIEHRLDERFKITPFTKNILKIEIMKD